MEKAKQAQTKQTDNYENLSPERVPVNQKKSNQELPILDKEEAINEAGQEEEEVVKSPSKRSNRDVIRE